MPRYKLRTLLILLAILPPLLAFGWWKYSAWRAEHEEQDRRRAAADAARQFVLAPQQLTQAPIVLTAAEQPAREAAIEARIQTAVAARYAILQKAREDLERAEDERLQQQGYLRARFVPRIQPQPKAPAKVGE